MPYIKLPNFKMGINPSVRSKIEPLALTGTQKLLLASSRIFGTSISGNLRSGNKELSKKFSPEKELVKSYFALFWLCWFIFKTIK